MKRFVRDAHSAFHSFRFFTISTPIQRMYYVITRSGFSPIRRQFDACIKFSLIQRSSHFVRSATNICIVSCCFRNNSSISPFCRNNSITVVLSSIGGVSFSIHTFGGGGGVGGVGGVTVGGGPGVSFSTHPLRCVIYRASCLYTLSQYSHLYSSAFDNSTQIINAITNATSSASAASSAITHSYTKVTQVILISVHRFRGSVVRT